MSSYNSEPTVPAGEPHIPAVGDEFIVTEPHSETKERAQGAADSVAGPASDVKDHAVSAGKDVAQTAQAEAGQVVDEAKQQGRRLFDEGVTELRTQADTVQSRLAELVHSLADELGAMADAPEASGPMTQLARTGRDWGNEAASFLEGNDVDGVLRDARRYAARNPWTFLAIAGGAGLLVGRFARGLKDAAPSNEGTVSRRQVYGQSGSQNVYGESAAQGQYRGHELDAPYSGPDTRYPRPDAATLGAEQDVVAREQRDGGNA